MKATQSTDHSWWSVLHFIIPQFYIPYWLICKTGFIPLVTKYGVLMTIWLTADTHFFHHNVIRYCNRPYENVDQMNESLIETWNECIKPDDLVYHLGDFGFGNVAKIA